MEELKNRAVDEILSFKVFLLQQDKLCHLALKLPCDMKGIEHCI